jgi:hypothetical protein
MKNLKFVIPAILILITASSFTYFAKWVIIGQKQASYSKDRDVLNVSKNDVFRAIKIKVVDAPLDMMDLDIYFENGEKMNVAIQKKFSQGEESRTIDLKGNKRRIEKITFLYDTKGVFKGKANVIVFGKR